MNWNGKLISAFSQRTADSQGGGLRGACNAPGLPLDFVVEFLFSEIISSFKKMNEMFCLLAGAHQIAIHSQRRVRPVARMAGPGPSGRSRMRRVRRRGRPDRGRLPTRTSRALQSASARVRGGSTGLSQPPPSGPSNRAGSRRCRPLFIFWGKILLENTKIPPFPFSTV